MNPTPTQQYIEVLTQLKAGDLALLRTHAGQALDESVDGFDLFAGLWWPLREKNERAPRRAVAWLIAKLYACAPVPHCPSETLARQLGRCRPNRDPAGKSFRQRFDALLTLPSDRVEPALQWALQTIDDAGRGVDWVQLTNDLSVWERERTRLKWANEYLSNDERG